MSGIYNHFPSKSLRFICAVAGIGITVAIAADTADLVLSKVRANINADMATSQGVACMEAVERTRYMSRIPAQGASCSALMAATANTPRGPVEWRDRLRLDVTAGSSGEEFALTGVSSFERGSASDLVSAAAAGRGEFTTFLRNLIGGDGEPFQSRGLQQTPLGRLVAFGFDVPAAKSHFFFGGAPSANGPHAAYRGSMYAVADSNDLKRVTLESENVGPACRVQYTIDYTATRVGEREIVLPQNSIMDVLYNDGRELHTETYYSSCHRPRPETTPAVPAIAQAPPASAPASGAAMPEAQKPLPAGTRFRVRFQVPINVQTAATGDPLIGVIRTTVKDKQNGVIIHAGDRIHGRIASLEEYLLPQHQWNLTIAFQTIERGVGEHGIDEGVEQAVHLVPLDDGDRAPHDQILTPADMQRLRPSGGAYFVFHDPSVLLDKAFETEWEIR